MPAFGRMSTDATVHRQSPNADTTSDSMPIAAMDVDPIRAIGLAGKLIDAALAKLP
jgi:hypothetical protein